MPVSESPWTYTGLFTSVRGCCRLGLCRGAQEPGAGSSSVSPGMEKGVMSLIRILNQFQLGCGFPAGGAPASRPGLGLPSTRGRSDQPTRPPRQPGSASFPFPFRPDG